MVSTDTSPRSHHTGDPLLQPFLSSSFDPTSYLNAALPSLSFAPPPSKSTNSLSLSELAAQTQSHIAQLSAQTARLTTTLTTLTDDILRSGSRLAYEVEVLRGESVSLSEALTESLSADIAKFVPEGLVIPTEAENGSVLPPPETPAPAAAPIPTQDVHPDPLASLRTLHHVRTSLQTVISTFDAALSWPLPPSLLSTSSSLISVASPDTAATSSLEAAGQEALARLHDEINDLLALGPEEGVLAAEKRVEELRDLVGVWKGTAEEKARGRVVDGLAKVVAERRREVEGRGGLVRKGAREAGERVSEGERGPREGGKGFLSNLQRLREEIYLE